MKSIIRRLVRILLASFFALVCFATGYFIPHHQAALANAGTASEQIKGDSVPGGFKGDGIVQVNNSELTAANRTTNSWGPCQANHKCVVSVHLEWDSKQVTGSVKCEYDPNTNCLEFVDEKDKYIIGIKNTLSNGFVYVPVYMHGKIEFPSVSQFKGL
jgi:hypothetical protein